MHTHSVHNNIERVKEILQGMEREIPDQISISDYNILIHGYAKLGQAMEAERIVKDLVDRYNKGGGGDKMPSRPSFLQPHFRFMG
jgi:pentatricopeptide repeat protein